LAISTRRFMPPDSGWIGLSFLSHSDSCRSTFSTCAGSAALPNSPREKETELITFSNGSSVISCGTRPISSRAARKSRTTSCPPTVTLPDVGRTMPQMVEMSVVLPAPLGPSSAMISPSSISRLTDLSAEKPDL